MNRRGFIGMLGGAVGAAASLALGLPKAKAVPLPPIELAPACVDPLNPLVPELWAKHAMEILTENMNKGNLAHQDWCDRLGIESVTDRIKVR